MKCDKCNNEMVQLFVSWVCDYCDSKPTKTWNYSLEESIGMHVTGFCVSLDSPSALDTMSIWYRRWDIGSWSGMHTRLASYEPERRLLFDGYSSKRSEELLSLFKTFEGRIKFARSYRIVTDDTNLLELLEFRVDEVRGE